MVVSREESAGYRCRGVQAAKAARRMTALRCLVSIGQRLVSIVEAPFATTTCTENFGCDFVVSAVVLGFAMTEVMEAQASSGVPLRKYPTWVSVTSVATDASKQQDQAGEESANRESDLVERGLCMQRSETYCSLPNSKARRLQRNSGFLALKFGRMSDTIQVRFLPKPYR